MPQGLAPAQACAGISALAVVVCGLGTGTGAGRAVSAAGILAGTAAAGAAVTGGLAAGAGTAGGAKPRSRPVVTAGAASEVGNVAARIDCRDAPPEAGGGGVLFDAPPGLASVNAWASGPGIDASALAAGAAALIKSPSALGA